MRDEMLRDAFSFIKAAGEIALNNQDTAATELKKDTSIVTETDLAISRMAREMLETWLEKEDHILVDEESVDQIGNPVEVFENSKYQWILDPIDGTAGYACGMDNWGILLSVLEEGQPFFSMMYFPPLKELHFATFDGWWKIQSPFSSQEKKSKVNAVHRPVTQSSLFSVQHKEYQYLESSPCIILSEYSPKEMISALEGKTVGKLGWDYIWDSAAILAFSLHSPVKLWDIKSNVEVKNLNASYFSNEWKWKTPYLQATSENKDVLVKFITKESF